MFQVYGPGGAGPAMSPEEALRAGRVGRVAASPRAAGYGRRGDAGPAGRGPFEDYRRDLGWQDRPEPAIRADRIMSAPARCVEAACPTEEALRIMGSARIRHLPVLSGGRLAGLVSERDLLARLARGKGTGADPVAGAMSSPVLVAAPEAGIRAVARVLFRRRLGCMPVVDPDGAVIGMVTRGDILEALIHHPSLSLWA